MIDGMRKPKRTWPRTSDPVTGAFVDLETGELHDEWIHIKRRKPKLGPMRVLDITPAGGDPIVGDVYTVVATYDELTGEWRRREVPGRVTTWG